MDYSLPITPVIKHELTQDVNREELYYRDVIQPNEGEFRQLSSWLIRSLEKSEILSELYRFIEFKGEILELGAGSCWFSSGLSLLGSVSRIYCLDMSRSILENIAPYVMKHLGANTEKLFRVIGDFNKLWFQDRKFDFVVFDASLHHIPESNHSRVLKEVYRVLRTDGKVVAINEPFLSSNSTFNKYRKSRFGVHERKYGVTENIYTKEEWKRILENVGFRCFFIPQGFIKTNNSLELKNLMKRVIKKSFLKGLFLYFFPRYFVVLEK